MKSIKVNLKTCNCHSCFFYCIISLVAFNASRKGRCKENSCKKNTFSKQIKSYPARALFTPIFLLSMDRPIPSKARLVSPDPNSRRSTRTGGECLRVTRHSWLWNDPSYTENATVPFKGDTHSSRPCSLVLYNEWTVVRSWEHSPKNQGDALGMGLQLNPPRFKKPLNL